MIDAFHLEHYGETAVMYNRDLKLPVLRRIIEKITGEEFEYNSPTDMGVNRVGLHHGRRVCREQPNRKLSGATCRRVDYKKDSSQARRSTARSFDTSWGWSRRTGGSDPALEYVERKRKSDLAKKT